METASRPIPKWILIISGLLALLEIIVSLMLCFSPDSMADSINLSAKGVDFLMYMWAARQFALGFIFAYATWKRSVPMLTIVYVFFFVMLAGELVMGIVLKQTSLILAAVVMCLLASAVLYILQKRK